WDYVSAWSASKVPKLLNDAVREGKVLAGTSAGAHVMSAVAYDARNGSVRLGEAVRNPWDEHVTFTHDLLSVLPGVLVDTHFTQRGRLARLGPMFVRLLVDDAPTLRCGVGIDDRTALLVSPTGTADVRGEGSVSLLRADASTSVSGHPGQPPSAYSIRLDVLGDGYRIDLDTGEIVERPLDAVLVTNESPQAPPNPATLLGSDPLAAQSGSVSLASDQPGDLYHGSLETTSGDGALPGFVVVSETFDPSQLEMVENRVGGVQWVLHEMAGTVGYGLVLDTGAQVKVGTDGSIRPQPVADQPAVMLLDGRHLVETASTPYEPRQSVSLVGLRLHLLRDGDGWVP
ncbi:MAG: cyanophycinase, partial [Myxococcota bacterium]